MNGFLMTLFIYVIRMQVNLVHLQQLDVQNIILVTSSMM